MTLPKIDDDTLRHILSENLTPSRTIRTPERLFGREKNLVTIERAFNSPGRQVFIYGDRGVGKSSLALTAGYLNASVESGDPIYLVCDKNSTFSEIIRSVGQGTASVTSRMEVPGKSASLTGSIAGFGGGFQPGSRSAAAIPEPSNLNEALDIIKYVGHKRNGRTVVIIDEMERLSKKDEKDKFAEFIKNIPEIDCDVRFIFCGIGSELDELLGEHPSAGRILETIKLGGLRYDSLWQIITATADKLGVDVEREILIRVGQISDGFPHYVHLIGETMFWSMFDEEKDVVRCDHPHFRAGVKGALQRAEATLRTQYDRATQKTKNTEDYEEALWALADKRSDRRQVTDIYENSYKRIMLRRGLRPILAKEVLNQRLLALRKESHGRVVVGYGSGWFGFRENILRGYVRLKAENAGIELGRDN